MNRLWSFLLFFGVASVAACGDGGSGPNQSVAGTYRATRFVGIPTGGGPVDFLALGGSIEVVLTPQGTTTGTLVVPAEFTEDGVDEDVIDLEGTYTRTGSTLTFQQQGDSFIPEVVWTIGPGTLTTTNIQPAGRIDVTLTRL